MKNQVIAMTHKRPVLIACHYLFIHLVSVRFFFVWSTTVQSFKSESSALNIFACVLA